MQEDEVKVSVMSQSVTLFFSKRDKTINILLLIKQLQISICHSIVFGETVQAYSTVVSVII